MATGAQSNLTAPAGYNSGEVFNDSFSGTTLSSDRHTYITSNTAMPHSRPAQWGGRHVDFSQLFDQHPDFAKAVNTLSDAISRSGAASASGSPEPDQIASAGTRAFALFSQMMANDFGNASHFAQAGSSTAQTQQQTSNLLTRPLR